MSRLGGEKRGNARNRFARKMWMLSPNSPFGGDGEHVLCVHGCGTVLDFDSVQADRIIPGGSYRRDNVQPSCWPCNRARSNNLDWILPAKTRELVNA